jgi:hypothetical protein
MDLLNTYTLKLLNSVDLVLKRTIPTFIHSTRNYKYNAIADVHTLKITISPTKFSQSVFISHFLVTDLNGGDSSASVITPFPAG